MNKPIIALAIFAAGTLFGSYLMDSHWQAKWNEAEKTASLNQVNQINSIIQKYNERVSQLEKITDETETKLAKVQSDNDNAIAINNSLQQSFTNSLRQRNQCASDTTTTAERATKATDTIVQAILFERITHRAIEYARIADENRIAGIACKMSYDNIRSADEK